jgi:NADPH-dependent 2,4-dienoyl-CoA reductase/sulfur reductase-like enzyme
LDAARRRIELADGSRLRYESLLIATGSEPVRLPALAGLAGVQALRTLADAARLRAALDAGAHVAVVGGGLIGLELASSARARGAAVTVIEAAPCPLAGAVGVEVGAHLAAMHREDGARLRLGVAVAEARGGTAGIEEEAWAGGGGGSSGGQPSGEEPSGGGPSGEASPGRGSSGGRPSAPNRVEELVLADGARIAVDHVVEAIGVRPAAGWLAGSGLDPRGVPVGTDGRTALPHVFAAGDVTGSGHWEAAARPGAAVARSLLGLPPAPPAPPSFWSDQLGVRLQCVGDPRGARAELRIDADGRGFEAVYRREGRVTAVLLAGRPASALRAARRLLSPEPELERSAA